MEKGSASGDLPLSVMDPHQASAFIALHQEPQNLVSELGAAVMLLSPANLDTREEERYFCRKMLTSSGQKGQAEEFLLIKI